MMNDQIVNLLELVRRTGESMKKCAEILNQECIAQSLLRDVIWHLDDMSELCSRTVELIEKQSKVVG